MAFLLPLGRAIGQAVDNSTEQQVMHNLPSSYANHSSNESSTELQDKNATDHFYVLICPLLHWLDWKTYTLLNVLLVCMFLLPPWIAMI